MCNYRQPCKKSICSEFKPENLMTCVALYFSTPGGDRLPVACMRRPADCMVRHTVFVHTYTIY